MKEFIFINLLGLFFSQVCFSQTQTTYQNTPYELRVQKREVERLVYTANSVVLHVKVSVFFHIRKADVPRIHYTLGPGYADMLVADFVSSQLGTLVSQFESGEILSSRRGELTDQLRAAVRKKLETYRIQLKELDLVSVDYTPEVTEAISAKTAAAERVAVAKMNLEVEKLKLEAQKEAVAAEAEINKQRSKGLDAKILQLQYIHALEKLASSPNSKIVVFGNGAVTLPSFSGSAQTP